MAREKMPQQIPPAEPNQTYLLTGKTAEERKKARTEERNTSVTQPRKPRPADTRQKRGSHELKPQWAKATFVLPLEVLEKLERAWLDRRAAGGADSKSELVRQALEAFLRGGSP